VVGGRGMFLERPNLWAWFFGRLILDDYTQVSCFDVFVEKEYGQGGLEVTGFQQHRGRRQQGIVDERRYVRQGRC
jgi:hypothetical protein